MARYRAIVAYDGTAYNGFQRQADGIPTIQGAIEAALEAISGGFVRIKGAGRTDTGVHAAANVIAFDMEWRHAEDALLRALNVTLPMDIAIQRLERAAPDFHPRFDADSRTYRYVCYEAPVRNPLVERTAWHIHRRGAHDLAAMNEAAALIIGEHDFASFGNPTHGESTTRYVLRSAWHTERLAGITTEHRLLVYEVEANGFLHHMVRALVGTQVDVGSHQWTVADFAAAFAAKDRRRAKQTAPPNGLTLTDVRYPTPNDSGNAPLTGD
jgi:tRNA pseudouridine38-40 synthase